MKVLIGKKVILFPLEECDLETFIKLHREDRNGYMCRFCLKNMSPDEAKAYVLNLLATGQIVVWTGFTKEGKASRRCGFIYMSDIKRHSVSISGILDKEFARGITKYLNRDKYTFSQDALHTLAQFAFEEMRVARVEMDIIENNRIALALAKKERFVKEGVLRNYVITNDQLENVVILSMLTEEWFNGKIE